MANVDFIVALSPFFNGRTSREAASFFVLQGCPFIRTVTESDLHARLLGSISGSTEGLCDATEGYLFRNCRDWAPYLAESISW